ncbi:PD40 domain-containing protein [bacterium]|nr:PD40 domain-containing protein [bacterium]NUM74808.1 PD40 domain-containing protein [candidate division KSB1 bacterium]RIK72481.1 MAG: hypothetical protein DCC62_19535 [candidate division KSB1 bacterium]
MKTSIRIIAAAFTAAIITVLACKEKTPVGHEEITPPDYNDDRDPDWSPDGLTIAFTHSTVPGDTSGGPFGIYFINADGNNRRLFLLGAHSPDWSPDGSRLAFVLGGQICIINRDSSGFKSLEVEGFFPDWSPNGSTIAYDIGEGGHTYFVNVNRPGQSQKFLDNAWSATWSPNGQYLAFSRTDNPHTPRSSIYTAKADGTGLLQLAKSLVDIDFYKFPNYSYQGDKIAYSSSKGGIHLIDANGANKKNLSRSGSHPTWSPNDAQIVFGASTSIPGRGRLYIVQSDGSNLKQLTF